MDLLNISNEKLQSNFVCGAYFLNNIINAKFSLYLVTKLKSALNIFSIGFLLTVIFPNFNTFIDNENKFNFSRFIFEILYSIIIIVVYLIFYLILVFKKNISIKKINILSIFLYLLTLTFFYYKSIELSNTQFGLSISNFNTKEEFYLKLNNTRSRALFMNNIYIAIIEGFSYNILLLKNYNIIFIFSYLERMIGIILFSYKLKMSILKLVFSCIYTTVIYIFVLIIKIQTINYSSKVFLNEENLKAFKNYCTGFFKEYNCPLITIDCNSNYKTIYNNKIFEKYFSKMKDKITEDKLYRNKNEFSNNYLYVNNEQHHADLSHNNVISIDSLEKNNLNVINNVDYKKNKCNILQSKNKTIFNNYVNLLSSFISKNSNYNLLSYLDMYNSELGYSKILNGNGSYNINTNNNNNIRNIPINFNLNNKETYNTTSNSKNDIEINNNKFINLGTFEQFDKNNKKIGLFDITYRVFVLYDKKVSIDIIFYDLSEITKSESKKTELKLKDALFSKIAHEFRTPIITITSQLEELENNINDIGNIAIKDFLNNNIINYDKQNSKKLMSSNIPFKRISMPGLINFNRLNKLCMNDITNNSQDYNCIADNIYTQNGNNNLNNVKKNINTNNTSLINNKYSSIYCSSSSIRDIAKNVKYLSHYLNFLISDIVQYTSSSNISSLSENQLANLRINSLNSKLVKDVLSEIFSFNFCVLNSLITYWTGNKQQIKTKLLIDEDISNYTAYVDIERVNQMFINFVSNSIKFTKKGEIVLFGVLEKNLSEYSNDLYFLNKIEEESLSNSYSSSNSNDLNIENSKKKSHFIFLNKSNKENSLFTEQKIINNKNKDIKYLLLGVKDSGIGINKNYLKSLSLNTASLINEKDYNTSNGSGLGLILCIQIAKLLNIELRIKSYEGYGSVVLFKIPLYKKTDKNTNNSFNSSVYQLDILDNSNDKKKSNSYDFNNKKHTKSYFSNYFNNKSNLRKKQSSLKVITLANPKSKKEILVDNNYDNKNTLNNNKKRITNNFKGDKCCSNTNYFNFNYNINTNNNFKKYDTDSNDEKFYSSKDDNYNNNNNDNNINKKIIKKLKNKKINTVKNILNSLETKKIVYSNNNNFNKNINNNSSLINKLDNLSESESISFNNSNNHYFKKNNNNTSIIQSNSSSNTIPLIINLNTKNELIDKHTFNTFSSKKKINNSRIDVWDAPSEDSKERDEKIYNNFIDINTNSIFNVLNENKETTNNSTNNSELAAFNRFNNMNSSKGNKISSNFKIHINSDNTSISNNTNNENSLMNPLDTKNKFNDNKYLINSINKNNIDNTNNKLLLNKKYSQFSNINNNLYKYKSNNIENNKILNNYKNQLNNLIDDNNYDLYISEKDEKDKNNNYSFSYNKPYNEYKSSYVINHKNRINKTKDTFKSLENNNNLKVPIVKFSTSSTNTKILSNKSSINYKLYNEHNFNNYIKLNNTNSPINKHLDKTSEDTNINKSRGPRLSNDTVNLFTGSFNCINNNNYLSNEKISVNNSENNKDIIIICDDSKVILNSLENLILSIDKIKESYRIIKVPDGIYLLSSIIDCQFDEPEKLKLIITDENMEFMNGSNAIKIIKTMQLNKKISVKPKIVSLTAFEGETKNIIISCGADKVLAKPSKKNVLNNLFKEYGII